MSAPARAPEAMGKNTQHRPATVTEGYSAVSFVPTDMPQTAVCVFEDMIVIDTIMPPTRYLPPTLSMTKLAAQMQTDLLAEIARLGLGEGSQVGSIAHPRSEAAEAEPPRGVRGTGKQISAKLRPKDKRRAELGIRSLRGEPYLSYFPPPKEAEPTVVNGVKTTCPCVCCRSGCSGADPSTGRLKVIESALAPEPKATKPEPQVKATEVVKTDEPTVPLDKSKADKAAVPVDPPKVDKQAERVTTSASDDSAERAESSENAAAASAPPQTVTKPSNANTRTTAVPAKTTDDFAYMSLSDYEAAIPKRPAKLEKGVTRITVHRPRKSVSQLKSQKSVPDLRQVKADPMAPPFRTLISNESRQLKPEHEPKPSRHGQSHSFSAPKSSTFTPSGPSTSSVPPVPPVPPIPMTLPLKKSPSAPQGPPTTAVLPIRITRPVETTEAPVKQLSQAVPVPSVHMRSRSHGNLSSSPPDSFVMQNRPVTHSTVTMRYTPKTPPRRITPPRRADFDGFIPHSLSGMSQTSLKTLPTPGLSVSSLASSLSSPGSRCEAMYGNSPPPFMHYDSRNEPRVNVPNKFASHTSTRLWNAARADAPPPLPEDAAVTVAQHKADGTGLQPALRPVGSRIRIISGNSPLLRSPAL
ncbi:hypothetical protein MCUN1_000800 [Malassezia cuniculi]|uniref:Uncharacterized protein n=1 Tax=Malassezia cuniculi TaxID=948313 RepID=A0AAF0J4Z6_9BASI|nr:hypothetical protein MCUN1_000800 [Malassezia cuniculi]